MQTRSVGQKQSRYTLHVKPERVGLGKEVSEWQTISRG